MGRIAATSDTPDTDLAPWAQMDTGRGAGVEPSRNTRPPAAPPVARARGERGAALVEFSLVMILLFALLFGIIAYSFVMSFRGSMAQSAAEGARAAATSPRPDVLTRTAAGTAQAVGAFNQTCAAAGPLTCDFTIHDCADTAAPLVDTPADLKDCMTVSLVYDYDAEPLLPSLPGLGFALPDTLRVKSVVELNPA